MALRNYLSKTNVIIVSHETTYGPQHALLDYLRKKKVRSSALISHPLSPMLKYRVSRMAFYEKGKLVRIIKFPFIECPETLLFIKDSIATLFFIMMIRKRFDIYIGADSLNAITGLFLRKIGFAKVVIYYSHSYRMVRFVNPVKNVLYHKLDKICIGSVDFVWNLSRTLTTIRDRQGVPKWKNVWVPIGIDIRKIKTPRRRISEDSSNRRKIVFMGLLEPINGVQLLIEALPDVLRAFPDVELIIIGEGTLEKQLKEMVREASLEKHVKFLGYMKYTNVIQFLSECGIGLAPYAPIPDSTLWTTDPMKLKVYMACGIPVIVTSIPESASEIVENHAGLVINYDKNELVNAISKMLTDDDFYCKCKENAVKVASTYDWEEIFSSAFKLMGDPTVGKVSEK